MAALGPRPQAPLQHMGWGGARGADLAEINENSTTEHAAAGDLQLGGVGGSGGVGCCARRRGVPRTPPEKPYFLALVKINHF